MTLTNMCAIRPSFRVCHTHTCMQMALARADSAGALFSGPVVVLAEEDKEWMDDTVSVLCTPHA